MGAVDTHPSVQALSVMKAYFLIPLLTLASASPSQLYRQPAAQPFNYGFYEVQKPTTPPPICTKTNETVCERIDVEVCGVDTKEVCLEVPDTTCETTEEEKCTS